MLDYRIRTFLRVCETGSYSETAKELNLTQPAVSGHIHYLEKEYGTTLFELKGRGVRITKEGELLRDAAIRMQNDDLHLSVKMQEIKNKKIYIIGATMTVAVYMMPSCLMELMRAEPDSSICIKVHKTATLTNMLNEGKIDLAIVEGGFARDQFDYRIITSEKCIAAASPAIASKYTDNKDGRKTCRIEELFGETLLIRETGTGIRDIIEQNMLNLGHNSGEFRNVIELESIELTKRLACEGFGVTFAYESALKEEMKRGSLIPIDIEGMNIRQDICFIYPKNSLFKSDFEKIFNEMYNSEDQH